MAESCVNVNEIVLQMREVFNTGRTKSIEWRVKQLEQIVKLFDENEDKINEALKKDLFKSNSESQILEVQYTRNDCVYCINNLEGWAKPEKVQKNLMTVMDSAYIKAEPFGVALIIGAWNYPIQLAMLPLIGAVCAGNCVILKPSELSWNTAVLLAELIPKYLDNDCIQVINGGVPETTALLKERFDYIFYTGNSMVGKIVMEAAAKHLTPVTLELGGKSPVYIDKDCDMGIVANRLLWGKCANSGQTCIAPDYVLCSKEVQEAFIKAAKDTMTKFYPDGPEKGCYGRIVNDRHFQRVKKLLDETNGTVAIGGQCNADDKFIAPTIITDVQPTDKIMQEEIFGPLLPVINVANEQEAVRLINNAEKPLALYIFSNNKTVINKIIDNTSSGGVCVNDTLMHCSLPSLPFGGVGNSGTGGYHGKFTFDTFSHKRSVMHRGLNMEGLLDIRYPPYTDKKKAVVNWLMKQKIKRSWFPWR